VDAIQNIDSVHAHAVSIEVSVIIPLYNAAQFIGQCLESVYATDFSGFEVIVVDDGSTDGGDMLAAGFPCRVLHQGRNRGPAAARNAGVGHARGRLLLFTDADCIVPVDWVKEVLAEYRTLSALYPRIGAVGGRVLPNKRFVSACLAYSGYYAFQNGVSSQVRPDLCSAHLLIVRSAFDDIGGFDETLASGEDTDATCALYRKGYSVVYDPALSVVHDHRKSMGDFLRHQCRWGREHGLRLEQKYRDIRKLPRFLLTMNPFLYAAFLALPVSLAITVRSIKANFRYDKKILLYAPFVFLSKLWYRWGVVLWQIDMREARRGQ
jgi:glycosyltransferase involved in cell wall biosynthesis